MLKNNEYFDGKVKSVGFETGGMKATVGVMEAGEYEFGTAGPELMTVVSGALTVKLSGSDTWRTFKSGDEFRVESQSRFQLVVEEASAYLCRYL